MCAARSITSKRAPGIRSATCSTTAGRSRRIVGACDHERRSGDSRRASSRTSQPRERLATACVALRVDGEHRLAVRGDVLERRREPAGQDRVDDRARVPAARTTAARSRYCSGLSNRAAVEASTSRSTRSGTVSASCIPTAPPSDRPTNEKVAGRDRAQDVVRELGDVRERDDGSTAVPGMVDPHDVTAVERRQLRLPDRRRRAERAAEDDGAAHPRCSARARSMNASTEPT